jgi:hypothetical protein
LKLKQIGKKEQCERLACIYKTSTSLTLYGNNGKTESMTMDKL